jgi:hypothetical protein
MTDRVLVNVVHDAIAVSNRQRRQQVGDVDASLRQQTLGIVSNTLMKVFNRCIEEMQMVAVASLTFSAEALTCDSHSG